jgi:hypothetical protein
VREWEEAGDMAIMTAVELLSPPEPERPVTPEDPAAWGLEGEDLERWEVVE